MIAPATTTQAHIDAILAKAGIMPLGKPTPSGLHMLYKDNDDHIITLPQSEEGYSYYDIEEIVRFVVNQLPEGECRQTLTYVAKMTPQIRLASLSGE